MKYTMMVWHALQDYASLLDSVIVEWKLTGFHAAAYELHASRCRKIAGKYAAAIGYGYDKAVERCERRRAKGERDSNTGMDGLEAFIRRRGTSPPKQEKSKEADGQQKGNQR